jgi:hypothetical protein
MSAFSLKFTKKISIIKVSENLPGLRFTVYGCPAENGGRRYGKNDRCNFAGKQYGGAEGI